MKEDLPLIGEDVGEDDVYFTGVEAREEILNAVAEEILAGNQNRMQADSKSILHEFFHSRIQKMRNYLYDDYLKLAYFCIYVLLCIGGVCYGMINYWNKPNYYITIARGGGFVLNFQCALLLFTVLKVLFVSYLRKIPYILYIIPIDANITFHKYIAMSIIPAVLLHATGHFLNYNTTSDMYKYALKEWAGISGFLLSFILIAIATSATSLMRRTFFNTFYITHHLYIIFYALLLSHGPRFWIWFLLPASLYVIERVIRLVRQSTKTTVIKTRNHPCNVMEVVMSKRGFSYKPGQYLYLNCPLASRFEWHPFTITSAPHEEYLTVHVKVAGDWTKQLKELISPADNRRSIMIDKSEAPSGGALLRVDGPFGAASEEVFNYKTSVLIGAGIGVTPFASILKSVLHRKQTNKAMRLQSIHFFWICRDSSAFAWFKTLLQDLEAQMLAEERKGQTDKDKEEEADDEEESTRQHFLSINIFVTGAFDMEKVREIAHYRGSTDKFTELKLSKTQFGRPNWGEQLKRVKETDRLGNKTIGVFLCGPRGLSSAVQQTCRRVSDGRCKFAFHKENF